LTFTGKLDIRNTHYTKIPSARWRIV